MEQRRARTHPAVTWRGGAYNIPRCLALRLSLTARPVGYPETAAVFYDMKIPENQYRPLVHRARALN